MTKTEDPRLFADAEAIRGIGERMLACTLPKSEWTHEAHISTTCWLLLERPDIAPERDLPGFIRRYNESVGGVNSDTEGYHETITQLFIRTLRGALAGGEGRALHERVNAVLLAPEGRRDWPLRFYSRALLFSREARLDWVEPDLAALPGSPRNAGLKRPGLEPRACYSYNTPYRRNERCGTIL
jgi:hypothetical protein